MAVGAEAVTALRATVEFTSTGWPDVVSIPPPVAPANPEAPVDVALTVLLATVEFLTRLPVPVMSSPPPRPDTAAEVASVVAEIAFRLTVDATIFAATDELTPPP